MAFKPYQRKFVHVMEDLQNLDMLLQIPEEKEKYVEYFQAIGGENAEDCTKRIMRPIMTHDTSCRRAFRGSGTKLRFDVFKNILMALIYAVRHHFPLATESLIDKTVQKWL